MQQVVYKCDQCKVEIGEKKHISMRFSNNTGIAMPPSTSSTKMWRVINELSGKFMHFCNHVCLGRFFGELYKNAGKHE